MGTGAEALATMLYIGHVAPSTKLKLSVRAGGSQKKQGGRKGATYNLILISISISLRDIAELVMEPSTGKYATCTDYELIRGAI